MKIQI